MEENKHILTIAEPVDSIRRLLERIEQMGYSLTYVKSMSELEEALESLKFKILLFNVNGCGDEESTNLLKEARQSHPDIKVVGIYNAPVEVTNKEIKDSGIDVAYSAGFEDEFLINTLFEVSPIELIKENLNLSLLTRINISEISGEGTLPFDVYVCLPANKKIILYRTKGSSLADSTVAKFKKHREYSLYIRKTDQNAYNAFYSKILQNIKDDPNLSNIDKQKAVRKELKGLMQGFFSADQFSKEEGDQLLAGVSNVLFQMEDASGSKAELMEPVMDLVSENMTTFSHAKNVATYCVLFGTILGIEEPESLKIGGFLHDIGLSDFDPENMFKNEEDLTKDEFAQYKLHPGNAKLSLTQKKLTIPKVSLNMILQHHEHPDGSGFPYGLKSEEIDPAAKVCALADEFDKLTSVRFGYAKYMPVEAMQKIAGLDGSAPSPIFEKEFHQPIIDFFLNTSVPEEAMETPAASRQKEADPATPPSKESEEENMADLFAEQMAEGSNEDEGPNLGDMFAAAMGGENAGEADVQEDVTKDDHNPAVEDFDFDVSGSVQASEDEIKEGKGVRVIPEVYQHTKPGFLTLSELMQNDQLIAQSFDKSVVFSIEDKIKDEYSQWESDLKAHFEEQAQKKAA